MDETGVTRRGVTENTVKNEELRELEKRDIY